MAWQESKIIYSIIKKNEGQGNSQFTYIEKLFLFFESFAHRVSAPTLGKPFIIVSKQIIWKGI